MGWVVVGRGSILYLQLLVEKFIIKIQISRNKLGFGIFNAATIVVKNRLVNMELLL